MLNKDIDNLLEQLTILDTQITEWKALAKKGKLTLKYSEFIESRYPMNEEYKKLKESVSKQYNELLGFIEEGVGYLQEGKMMLLKCGIILQTEN